MNNPKKILMINLLIFITLLSLFLVLNLYKPNNKGQEDASIIRINEINVGDIAAIAVVNENSSYGFLIDGNKISLETDKEKEEYSQEEMQAFIYMISKISSSKTIEDYDSLEDFGLQSPSARITIIKKDKSKFIYYLGDRNPLNDDYYLSLEGDHRIFIVDSVIGDLMLRNEFDFVKKDIFPKKIIEQLNLIESISIASKSDPHRTYTIENSKESKFMLTSPLKNIINPNKVLKDLILPLSAIYPNKLIDSQGDLVEYGLDDPDFIIELNFNQDEYKVLISQDDSEKYYICKIENDRNKIFEIDEDLLHFLQNNYLDYIYDSIYSSNITNVNFITFTDNDDMKDYNFDVTSPSSVLLEGNSIDYEDFIAIHEKINSIGVSRQLENHEEESDILNHSPFFTITVGNNDGSIDYLEFIKINKNESYLRVNELVNFVISNEIIERIKLNIHDILSQ